MGSFSHDVRSKPPPICICSQSGDESLPYSLVLRDPNAMLEESKVGGGNCNIGEKISFYECVNSYRDVLCSSSRSKVMLQMNVRWDIGD